MTAKYEVTIKLTIFDEVDSVLDIKDMSEIAETAAQVVCDNFADCGMVCSYEIVDRRLDAK